MVGCKITAWITTYFLWLPKLSLDFFDFLWIIVIPLNTAWRQVPSFLLSSGKSSPMAKFSWRRQLKHFVFFDYALSERNQATRYAGACWLKREPKGTTCTERLLGTLLFLGRKVPWKNESVLKNYLRVRLIFDSLKQVPSQKPLASVWIVWAEATTFLRIPELINLQNVNGKAKPYQLKQLLSIIEQHNLHMEE